MIRKTSFFILISIIMAFSSGCWKTSEETRLKRREILYTFSHKGTCTEFHGKGGIRNTSPEKVIATLKTRLSDLGYISLSQNSFFSWDFPWPFNDISEKVTILTTPEKISLTHVDAPDSFYSDITFSAHQFSPSLAILEINGVVCQEMPEFILENSISSTIKEVIKTIRDSLE